MVNMNHLGLPKLRRCAENPGYFHLVVCTSELTLQVFLQQINLILMYGIIVVGFNAKYSSFMNTKVKKLL
jgi:hypothetical protein